jgi:hypothetical protein
MDFWRGYLSVSIVVRRLHVQPVLIQTGGLIKRPNLATTPLLGAAVIH